MRRRRSLNPYSVFFCIALYSYICYSDYERLSRFNTAVQEIWMTKNKEQARQYAQKYERQPARLYSKLKTMAKHTNRVMSLTLEDFLKLRLKPCHYCGGSLPPTGTGVDRRDNNLHYTKENSVPCCSLCNSLKGKHLTEAEVKLIIKFRKGILWASTQNAHTEF